MRERTAAALREALAAAIEPRLLKSGLDLFENESAAMPTPLCAKVAGFSVHAARVVPAHETSEVTVTMANAEDRWKAYIEQEVRTTCLGKQWDFQIRRKWSVREKPVSQSEIEDYEWKLIPRHELRKDPADNLEDGTYYVLGVDRPGRRFELQHGSSTYGIDDPPWECISTQIHIVGARSEDPPPKGWLREQLVALTNRFPPYRFSVT